MPLDPTIPLQAKAPDPLQTMGQWIGLARQKQQLERETATLPTDIEKSRAEAELARINTDKAQRTLNDYLRGFRAETDTKVAGAKVATGSADADIEKRKAESRTAQTGAARAGFELAADQMQLIRNQTNRFLNDPDFDPAKPNRDRMIEKIDDVRQELIESGVPRAMAAAMTSRLIAQAASDPKSVRQMLLTSINAGLGAQGQAVAAIPTGVQTSSGQVTRVINTNPQAGVPVGADIPGTRTQQQLPPNTPTVIERSQGVYQGGYVGPQGAGARPAVPSPQPGAASAPAGPAGPAPDLPPSQAPQPPRGFVPSGPPMGAEGNVAGIVDVVNRDRQQTANAAAAAQQNLATLSKIESVVSKAPTGVGAYQRSVAADIGSMLGMQSGDEVKSAADLLNKYSAQLQTLSGGNTDLARSIVEAANPNNKMSETAIRKVVRELAAVHRMALAKDRFLSPFQYDPVTYRQRLEQFNRVADPRVFQWPSMSVAEQKALIQTMTPDERSEFAGRVRTAQRDLRLLD